jgi:methyl-accepting chemotaxis protein
MRNWKVGVRLAVAFGLLLALMVVAVGFGLHGIWNAEEQASRLERENVAMIDAANAMRVAQLNEAIAIRDFVSLADLDSQRAALRMLKESEAAYAEALPAVERVAALMQNAAIAAQVGKLKNASVQVHAKIREAIELSESAEYQQAQNLVHKEIRPLQAAIGSGLQGLAVRSQELARERAQLARNEAASSERRLLVVVTLALLVGILATVLITRGIVRPLRSALDTAERVAGGDLTVVRVEAARDETGRVLAALAGMQARLNELVRAIREGADAVSQASERISEGNSDLAVRTEEEASSLEETAASIEQLTASVKQNSDNAGKASELASSAAQLAAEGGTAVGGVVESMTGIQRSSRKVSDIVALMDEMAFQTNLLALNAAVEAARAGEQGRGFGVVAAQVRALAQRSAEASKDIRKLVNDAVTQANQGATAATRAGDTMEKVVRVVGDVARLVAEIARANEEQRSGIEQVNATIAQLEGVTQSNNNLVQEVSSLTESLLHQSRGLVTAASQFKLDAVAPAGPLDAGDRMAPLPWAPTPPALT